MQNNHSNRTKIIVLAVALGVIGIVLMFFTLTEFAHYMSIHAIRLPLYNYTLIVGGVSIMIYFTYCAISFWILKKVASAQRTHEHTCPADPFMNWLTIIFSKED